MRISLFGGRTCRGRRLRYYLLAEAREGPEEEYGLRVEYAGEAETIRGVTVSLPGIRSLLGAMLRGGVTPTTARDVVEDWLLC